MCEDDGTDAYDEVYEDFEGDGDGVVDDGGGDDDDDDDQDDDGYHDGDDDCDDDCIDDTDDGSINENMFANKWLEIMTAHFGNFFLEIPARLVREQKSRHANKETT